MEEELLEAKRLLWEALDFISISYYEFEEAVDEDSPTLEEEISRFLNK